MTRPAPPHRLLPAVFAALLLAVAMPTSSAAAPVVAVETRGDVVLATVDLPVAPEAVLAVLKEVGSQVSPNIVATRIEKEEGLCVEVWNQAQAGPFAIELRVLRCRTETGWRETLLSSNLLRSLQTEWQILPTSEGTRIELTMQVDAILPLPDLAKLSRLKTAAADTLIRLALLTD